MVRPQAKPAGGRLSSLVLGVGMLSLGACHADYCGLANELPEACASSLIGEDVGECRDQVSDHCSIDESLALVSYVECIDTETTLGASCSDDGIFDTLMSCVNELKPVDPLCLNAIF